MKRITGIVASSNEAARKFDEHLGFELEAILLGAHPDGDLLVYKMTADKCRWLKDLPYEHVCRLGIPDLPERAFRRGASGRILPQGGKECAEGSELRVTGSRAITELSFKACPRAATGKPCKPGYAVR